MLVGFISLRPSLGTRESESANRVRMAFSQARSPLLANQALTDQALIDHFKKLRDGADWWDALK